MTAPTVECIACSMLNMRSYPQHALDGVGECRAFHPTPWVQIDRIAACEAFKPVGAVQTEKRRRWFAARHEAKASPGGAIATDEN